MFKFLSHEVCNGSTDPPHEYDVLFHDDLGQLIVQLSEYRVGFGRVVDLFRLYRNTLDGKTPSLPLPVSLYSIPRTLTVRPIRGI